MGFNSGFKWLEECVYGVTKEVRLETVNILFFDSFRRPVTPAFVFHPDWNTAYYSEFNASQLYSPTVLSGAWKRESAETKWRLIEFYVLLIVHPSTILQINPTRCTILLSIFISLLYMFRATVCPSSGEITVSMWHWYMPLSMSGVWSAGWSETPTSRPDATHTEWHIPVSHGYSNFSWWWAHGCPKHVEKRNKYTKQNCASSWIYL